jgi:hypothetical protein
MAACPAGSDGANDPNDSTLTGPLECTAGANEYLFCAPTESVTISDLTLDLSNCVGIVEGGTSTLELSENIWTNTDGTDTDVYKFHTNVGDQNCTAAKNYRTDHPCSQNLGGGKTLDNYYINGRGSALQECFTLDDAKRTAGEECDDNGAGGNDGYGAVGNDGCENGVLTGAFKPRAEKTDEIKVFVHDGYSDLARDEDDTCFENPTYDRLDQAAKCPARCYYTGSSHLSKYDYINTYLTPAAAKNMFCRIDVLSNTKNIKKIYVKSADDDTIIVDQWASEHADETNGDEAQLTDSKHVTIKLNLEDEEVRKALGGSNLTKWETGNFAVNVYFHIEYNGTYTDIGQGLDGDAHYKNTTTRENANTCTIPVSIQIRDALLDKPYETASDGGVTLSTGFSAAGPTQVVEHLLQSDDTSTSIDVFDTRGVFSGVRAGEWYVHYWADEITEVQDGYFKECIYNQYLDNRVGGATTALVVPTKSAASGEVFTATKAHNDVCDDNVETPQVGIDRSAISKLYTNLNGIDGGWKIDRVGDTISVSHKGEPKWKRDVKIECEDIDYGQTEAGLANDKYKVDAYFDDLTKDRTYTKNQNVTVIVRVPQHPRDLIVTRTRVKVQFSGTKTFGEEMDTLTVQRSTLSNGTNYSAILSSGYPHYTVANDEITLISTLTGMGYQDRDVCAGSEDHPTTNYEYFKLTFTPKNPYTVSTMRFFVEVDMQKDTKIGGQCSLKPGQSYPFCNMETKKTNCEAFTMGFCEWVDKSYSTWPLAGAIELTSNYEADVTTIVKPTLQSVSCPLYSPCNFYNQTGEETMEIDFTMTINGTAAYTTTKGGQRNMDCIVYHRNNEGRLDVSQEAYDIEISKDGSPWTVLQEQGVHDTEYHFPWHKDYDVYTNETVSRTKLRVRWKPETASWGDLCSENAVRLALKCSRSECNERNDCDMRDDANRWSDAVEIKISTPEPVAYDTTQWVASTGKSGKVYYPQTSWFKTGSIELGRGHYVENAINITGQSITGANKVFTWVKDDGTLVAQPSNTDKKFTCQQETLSSFHKYGVDGDGHPWKCTKNDEQYRSYDTGQSFCAAATPTERKFKVSANYERCFGHSDAVPMPYAKWAVGKMDSETEFEITNVRVGRPADDGLGYKDWDKNTSYTREFRNRHKVELKSLAVMLLTESGMVTTASGDAVDEDTDWADATPTQDWGISRQVKVTVNGPQDMECWQSERIVVLLASNDPNVRLLGEKCNGCGNARGDKNKVVVLTCDSIPLGTDGTSYDKTTDVHCYGQVTVDEHYHEDFDLTAYAFAITADQGDASSADLGNLNVTKMLALYHGKEGVPNVGKDMAARTALQDDAGSPVAETFKIKITPKKDRCDFVIDTRSMEGEVCVVETCDQYSAGIEQRLIVDRYFKFETAQTCDTDQSPQGNCASPTGLDSESNEAGKYIFMSHEAKVGKQGRRSCVFLEGGGSTCNATASVLIRLEEVTEDGNTIPSRKPHGVVGEDTASRDYDHLAPDGHVQEAYLKGGVFDNSKLDVPNRILQGRKFKIHAYDEKTGIFGRLQGCKDNQCQVDSSDLDRHFLWSKGTGSIQVYEGSSAVCRFQPIAAPTAVGALDAYSVNMEDKDHIQYLRFDGLAANSDDMAHFAVGTTATYYAEDLEGGKAKMAVPALAVVPTEPNMCVPASNLNALRNANTMIQKPCSTAGSNLKTIFTGAVWDTHELSPTKSADLWKRDNGPTIHLADQEMTDSTWYRYQTPDASRYHITDSDAAKDLVKTTVDIDLDYLNTCGIYADTSEGSDIKYKFSLVNTLLMQDSEKTQSVSAYCNQKDYVLKINKELNAVVAFETEEDLDFRLESVELKKQDGTKSMYKLCFEAVLDSKRINGQYISVKKEDIKDRGSCNMRDNGWTVDSVSYNYDRRDSEDRMITTIKYCSDVRDMDPNGDGKCEGETESGVFAVCPDEDDVTTAKQYGLDMKLKHTNGGSGDVERLDWALGYVQEEAAEMTVNVDFNQCPDELVEGSEEFLFSGGVTVGAAVLYRDDAGAKMPFGKDALGNDEKRVFRPQDKITVDLRVMDRPEVEDRYDVFIHKTTVCQVDTGAERKERDCITGYMGECTKLDEDYGVPDGTFQPGCNPDIWNENSVVPNWNKKLITNVLTIFDKEDVLGLGAKTCRAPTAIGSRWDTTDVCVGAKSNDGCGNTLIPQIKAVDDISFQAGGLANLGKPNAEWIVEVDGYLMDCNVPSRRLRATKRVVRLGDANTQEASGSSTFSIEQTNPDGDTVVSGEITVPGEDVSPGDVQIVMQYPHPDGSGPVVVAPTVEEAGMSGWTIVGIVVGASVGIGILVTVFVFTKCCTHNPCGADRTRLDTMQKGGIVNNGLYESFAVTPMKAGMKMRRAGQTYKGFKF